MKIWKCFDNLPAQDWFYTADLRIALTGMGTYFRSFVDPMPSPISDLIVIVGQCLDLTNGILTNGNPVQTFQCTDGNTNQIWTTTLSTS